jgi:hypothetical protein
MGKKENKKRLTLPPEDPELSVKASSRNKIPVHIEGGIHAGRDVIQGDQINYGARDIQISTPSEFVATLSEIQAALATLKQQPGLSPVQLRNLEAAETKIAITKQEAQKPDADASTIWKSLIEVKEIFDLLSGAIAPVAGLGPVLGNLIVLAVQLFE